MNLDLIDIAIVSAPWLVLFVWIVATSVRDMADLSKKVGDLNVTILDLQDRLTCEAEACEPDTNWLAEHYLKHPDDEPLPPNFMTCTSYGRAFRRDTGWKDVFVDPNDDDLAVASYGYALPCAPISGHIGMVTGSGVMIP